MRNCMLILLLAIAVVSLSSATPLAAEESTGDAPAYSIFYSPPERLDALFAAFMDCLKVDLLALFRSYSWNYKPDIIDYEKLVALEERFATMPEYWQLRLSSHEWTGSHGELEPNELLGKMVEVGAYDPLTNWLYAKRYDFGEEVLKEEAMLPYLRRLVELAPGQAAHHYELAHVLFRLGDFQEALRQVQIGNTAPHNQRLCAFPESYFRAHGRQIADVPEWQMKLLLSGIRFTESSFLLGDYLGKKDIFKDMVVAFNLSGNLEAMNDMHRWGVRMGTAAGADLIDCFVAVALVGILADGVGESGAITTSDADRRGFNRLKGLREELNQKAKERGREVRALWDDFLAEEAPPHFERDFFFVMGRMLTRANETWLLEPDWVASELGPIFEEMLEFDYTNPAAFVGD